MGALPAVSLPLTDTTSRRSRSYEASCPRQDLADDLLSFYAAMAELLVIMWDGGAGHLPEPLREELGDWLAATLLDETDLAEEAVWRSSRVRCESRPVMSCGPGSGSIWMMVDEPPPVSSTESPEAAPQGQGATGRGRARPACERGRILRSADHATGVVPTMPIALRFSRGVQAGALKYVDDWSPLSGLGRLRSSRKREQHARGL